LVKSTAIYHIFIPQLFYDTNTIARVSTNSKIIFYLRINGWLNNYKIKI